MQLLNVTEHYFITGTDTEIGKTVASIALIQAAKQRGWITAGYKPVASGSSMTSEGLRNDDALILQRNSSLLFPYILINPYTFFEPTSPHIISKDEEKPIEFSKLTKGLHVLEEYAEWVIIEGVGGWFTPLTQTQTFADWVKKEKLPVILVVGIKLGCINHAILTTQAIFHAGLCLAGWIANDITLPSKRHNEYLATLKQMIRAPFLGEIPWMGAKMKMEIEKTEMWHHLDLNLLLS